MVAQFGSGILNRCAVFDSLISDGAKPVGASLLAMVVNDNACFPGKRGALETIASKLAPTGFLCATFSMFAALVCGCQIDLKGDPHRSPPWRTPAGLPAAGCGRCRR
ncbi:hypothetical protein CD175_00105 [Pseudomonas laurylsulfatiphila]|uniref:Uncharacterized protein n=1 Tax=Pseudomonas laurylsulfatiphila TaxID=2011015 RepID=A0A2S6FRD1_9PSED|nr:hypothetical protein CD175_00105 [Pseudomonas laurylsulfatiphila]